MIPLNPGLREIPIPEELVVDAGGSVDGVGVSSRYTIVTALANTVAGVVVGVTKYVPLVIANTDPLSSASP